MAARTKRARVAADPPALAEAPAPAVVPAVTPPQTVAVEPRPANEIAQLFARQWKLIAVTAVVVTLLAWIIAARQPKRYQSEAIASVSPIVSQLSDSEVLHGIDALERRVVVATVAALASSDSTRRRTIGALRGDYVIDATVLPSTNLIRVSVEGPDPKQVASIANRIPALLDEQTRAMYRVYTVAPVSAGVVPTDPFLPRIGRAALLGLVLGVLLGVTIAYLIERYRSPGRR